MRSQDAVFGMGNDAPCFSFIHEMMYNLLKRNYPKLQYGKYFHIADSLHVYERHFEMLDKIANFKDKYTPVKCPKISGPEEVDFLLRTNFEYVPEVFQFTKWLNTFEKGIK